MDQMFYNLRTRRNLKVILFLHLILEMKKLQLRSLSDLFQITLLAELGLE